jgi:hypothetical protein
MTQLSLGFIPEILTISIELILPSKKTPAAIIGSRKFEQIRASIDEVGLIEPLSITPAEKKTSNHILLDGHVRLIALKELKYTEVPCLVAKDDETYTYNKQINRLSTIQEHFMIKRAIERGVSKERLSKALSIDMGHMMRKATLLDGICPEASDLLQDRQFSPDISRVLRKMKPTRQVECVELMTSANNITVSYAEALLVATPADMLIDGKKPQRLQGITQEQMLRMEREMASLQGQYKMVEQNYGQDMLNLVLARGYLIKMLDNKAISKFLKQRQPEVLEQFQNIIDTTSLDGTGASSPNIS